MSKNKINHVNYNKYYQEFIILVFTNISLILVSTNNIMNYWYYAESNRQLL